jgi:hyperosmotically inducible periplasmic protein
MNSELSRKIIVASGMAVVVGIIAVTFVLRHPHPAPVAQISQPPAAFAQIPDVPAQVTPTPEGPAAVASIPDAPAAVASQDNVGPKISDTANSSAVEPKVSGNRPPAKARISAASTNGTVTPESTVDSRDESAGETVAKNVDGVQNVDELPTSSSATTATDAQEGATSNEPAGSDRRITAELKSQFAADSISKNVDIGVTTTQGVVVLTGTLATQDAIDHVKNVAEKVEDVKSVDTSAMKITSSI